MNKEIEEVIKCFSSAFVNSGLTTYTLTEEKITELASLITEVYIDGQYN